MSTVVVDSPCVNDEVVHAAPKGLDAMTVAELSAHINELEDAHKRKMRSLRAYLRVKETS
jgi:hypothetical protein